MCALAGYQSEDTLVPSIDEPGEAAFRAPRARILVVEDELLIRFVISDELRNAGYDAIEASNADEALELLKTEVRIDLVLSDVRMPGSRDGLALLAIVRETLPGLPVIIMSGHLEPRLAEVAGATQFMSKPFPIADLLDGIRMELGSDG